MGSKKKRKGAGNGNSKELKRGLLRERNFSMASESSLERLERINEDDPQAVQVRITFNDLFLLHLFIQPASINPTIH